MGHMDDDNIERFTIHVRHKTGDASPEVFNAATNVDTDRDEIEFDDRNGKHHIFHGVTFHVAAE